MDPNSKQIATKADIDKTFMADPAAGSKLLCEHFDSRYKITFGNLEHKSSAKDDPMGLSALLGDSAPADDESSLISAEIARVPVEADGDNGLDAMKGKGKGKDDGR